MPARPCRLVSPGRSRVWPSSEIRPTGPLSTAPPSSDPPRPGRRAGRGSGARRPVSLGRERQWRSRDPAGARGGGSRALYDRSEHDQDDPLEDVVLLVLLATVVALLEAVIRLALAELFPALFEL